MEFCEAKGIIHEFSTPITPKQNGVVERKNRTLQGMARTMMKAQNIALRLWAKTFETACYICNIVYLKPLVEVTSYEIWKGRIPNVKHLHIFGTRCFIVNDRVQKKKLDDKGIEGIFVGYSRNSRAEELEQCY